VSKLESAIDSLQKFYGALPRPPRESVHRLRLGSPVGPFHAAKARCRARGTEAYSRADAGRDVARAAEEARRKRGACRTLPREPPRRAQTGGDLFRRSPQLRKILGGPLGPARRALKPFPQLGEAGAHRLLLFAADHPILPVDARLNRVGRRLGYGQAAADFKKQARSVQTAMSAELPDSVEAYRRAFLYLSHHGAATCTEAEPHCSVCPLLKDCPEGGRGFGLTMSGRRD
jgi:hypothetical protein